MSIKQSFSKYFSNHAETDEHHWDSGLRTHYFKITKDQAFRTLEEFFSDKKTYNIQALSKEYGEISINMKGRKKAFIVVSIIMVKPYRTAIDFSVTTESSLPVDFGFSHQLIKEFYAGLKKDLPFLETAMANKFTE